MMVVLVMLLFLLIVLLIILELILYAQDWMPLLLSTGLILGVIMVEHVLEHLLIVGRCVGFG